MQFAQLLRLAWLEAKACALRMGPLPPILAALFVWGARIQEPSIFREEGLELAWPSISAVSDVLFLVIIWQYLTLPNPARLRLLPSCLGLWVVGSLATLLAALPVAISDATRPHFLEVRHLQLLALRLALLWLPICGVSCVAWLQRRSVALRFLVPSAAYLMQASVLPASLTDSSAFVLITIANALVIALATSFAKRSLSTSHSSSIDAHRSPR